MAKLDRIASMHFMRHYEPASTIPADESGFSPLSLFSGSEQGAFYDPSVSSSVWQNSGRSTPAVADDPVGAIDDLSGNGDHLLQSTADKRPILRNATGLWYLEFDGSNDVMQTAATLWTNPLTTAWIGLAYRELTRQESSAFSIIGESDGSSDRWHAHMPWSDGTIYFDIDTATGSDRISASNPLSVGTDGVYVFASSDAANSQYFRVNGVQKASDASGSSIANGAGLILGAQAILAGPCHGRFYGVIVRSPILTTGEEADAETWLAATHGA